VAEFVWYVFSAGGVIASLLGAVVWMVLAPQSRRPRRLVAAIVLFYTLSSIYFPVYVAERLWSIGFRPLVAADVPDGRTAVVLLGSGSFTTRDWNETTFSIVDPHSAARVLEAVRVFNLLDPLWIISSGGWSEPDEPEEPSGVTMRDAMVRLGVPSSRILTEVESRNTHDEAVIVASMLSSIRVDQIVLVTSEVHMRRSLGAFRAQGVEAIPAIARQPYLDLPWVRWIFPSEGGLEAAALVAHEVIGLPYYALRGWYR
jgi:uncharacterized SAM-binding protein YcdF (DUF218 family)